MHIIISGLGKMGSQIARKLHEGGVGVIAHNRSKEKVDEIKLLGLRGAYTKKEAVDLAKDDRIVLWMMVPHSAVDGELADWFSFLPKGSVVIDGGNSDFRHTKKRSELVSENGFKMLDCGTSGGVWGYKNGFSMMIGGEKNVFEELEKIFQILSEPFGGYRHFGPSGAGHFVKMTHNAIEYGMMQSLAEGYHLLKEGPYKNIDLISAGEVWQKRSVINSWLNELVVDALKKNSHDLDFKNINGSVAESGETRFALETALEHGIELPVIQKSFEVRLESQKGKTSFATKLLSLMRNAFGGHKVE